MSGTLEAHFAFPITRKLRMRFKEALHLRLRLEATRGETFKGVLHDGRERLIADQHLAVMPRCAAEPVADRACERPIAIERPRPHTVARLLAVLAALVLSSGIEQVLGAGSASRQ